ncbi:MAG TPA: type II secretion system protein N [Steroidobacteraceae bacterium]|jgi:general secretion pathway protein N
MKRIWPILALGVTAYLVFALVTLPASLFTSRLASSGIHAVGVTGTIWNGRAQMVQAGRVNLGSASWKLHPLALLTAHLSTDLELTRTDGFVKTALLLSPSGRLQFTQLTATVPLSALPPAFFPGGWSGTLNLRMADLTIDHGWPASATGTIEAVDLTGPARKPANVGSYKIAFPAPGQAAGKDALVGALTDMGGPLQITGKVQLKTDRSYLIDGLIAATPAAPRDVANMLQFLGTPDAQGRRPFSLAGTF